MPRSISGIQGTISQNAFTKFAGPSVCMPNNYSQFSFAIPKKNEIEKHVARWLLLLLFCQLHIWYSTPADNHTNEIFVFSKLIKRIENFVFRWVCVSGYGYGCSADRHICAHIDLLVVVSLLCECMPARHISNFFIMAYVQRAVCCNYDYYCWYFFPVILWHWLKEHIHMPNKIYLVDAFASQSTAWCTNKKRWIGTKKIWIAMQKVCSCQH